VSGAVRPHVDVLLECADWPSTVQTDKLARSSLLLLLLLLHGLAGQRVARQSSAHSIVDFDIYRCLGSKRRFYLAAHRRVVSVLVWVRHPQGPPPPGSPSFWAYDPIFEGFPLIPQSPSLLPAMRPYTVGLLDGIHVRIVRS